MQSLFRPSRGTHAGYISPSGIRLNRLRNRVMIRPRILQTMRQHIHRSRLRRLPLLHRHKVRSRNPDAANQKQKTLHNP